MSGVSDRLAAEVTRIAMCWRLTRADGVVIGFTSHDMDLLVQGVRYRAGPGMTPSAVSQGDALRADSMDIEGVLDSSSIRGTDLDNGRWTGARVELFACDWSAPEAGTVAMLNGEIGDVARPFPDRLGAFRAELLTDADRIDRVGPVRLSPMCRAELGDDRCGVSMDGRRIEVVLAGGSGDRLLMASPVAVPDDFAGGRFRILDGKLCGIDRRIVAVNDAELILDEPLPHMLPGGTGAWLWQGCDKRFETCAGRFANALAFVGEPHVPGTDALIRYADG